MIQAEEIINHFSFCLDTLYSLPFIKGEPQVD